ncbi:three component ABC system middle component [Nitrosomonas communis]|uniref:three component ABC system middle component n=1 Tax=Nitrosomonas communis TaxID=44574 RepID=UPI003D2AD913
MEWEARTVEERNLLNPSFCSVLLWYAARGYASQSVNDGLPFEVIFLVLAIVLHRGTRESLPKTTKTSVPVWLDLNPLAGSHIADRSRALVPFTKEAMSFGGVYGMLRFQNGNVAGVAEWKRKIEGILSECSVEVRECAKRAEFLGKWFAKIGNASTILALFGVRP